MLLLLIRPRAFAYIARFVKVREQIKLFLQSTLNLKILNELSSQCALVLSPAEQEKMVADLSLILAFVDQIHTVPTEGVVPLIHPVNVGNLREADEPETTEPYNIYESEKIETVEGFYVVPKVIEP